LFILCIFKWSSTVSIDLLLLFFFRVAAFFSCLRSFFHCWFLLGSLFIYLFIYFRVLASNIFCFCFYYAFEFLPSPPSL
jgi:hypothetical protein